MKGWLTAMKAAIYTRKSKFTEEGESIDNQINMCAKYAENVLQITDYEVYEDEGFSGGNIDRPQFQKLIHDIKTKKFTHLICYRLDRISRNVADFSSTLEILNKNNCSFVSIKEQFDTSSAMGRAMMNISATFAQLERETIAERIKDNLRELAKTGRWLGGPPPMGYNSVEVENNDNNGKSRKKHILEINSEEIKTIKLVFQLFLKYKSFQRVSRELESMGLYSRKGSVFSRELVKQAITNPTYVIADKQLFNYLKSSGAEIYGENKINGTNGAMAYNRRKENGSFASMDSWIVSVGDHPGIINSDEWIKCQQIKKEISEKASNRQGTSETALLGGLVVCAKCGSGMSSRQHKSGKYHYRYYTCNLRNKSASRCDNDALNAYDAEENVVKYLKTLTEKDIVENYKKSLNSSAIKIDNTKAIDNYSKEIENNKITISNLVKKIAFIDDDLIDTVTEEIKKIKRKNKELQDIITELENKNSSLTDVEESLDDILMRFDNFKRFYDTCDKLADRQNLIRSVVKFITWDSESMHLEIVPFGSDRKRPGERLPFSPLEDRYRRNGTCRNNRYHGISNHGKFNY